MSLEMKFFYDQNSSIRCFGKTTELVKSKVLFPIRNGSALR